MSRSRTAPRPTTRALERLVARRRAADSQKELRAVLAGLHGEGVRADVRAAMKRQAPNRTTSEPARRRHMPTTTHATAPGVRRTVA